MNAGGMRGLDGGFDTRDGLRTAPSYSITFFQVTVALPMRFHLGILPQ